MRVGEVGLYLGLKKAILIPLRRKTVAKQELLIGCGFLVFYNLVEAKLRELNYGDC
jgi:hypothetical protein